MKVMNSLVITLEEDKRFLCVWLLYYESNFADSRMEVPRYQVLFHEIIYVSAYSAAVKCQAKLLPFGVNSRLQLAGLGKKREETVKPTCFSLLYVESDSAPQTPETNYSQHSSPVEALNLIVDSKSQPVELDNSTIELHVPSGQKKSLQSYCSVDF